MNTKINDTTEQRILIAARAIFQQKGYQGTSMQEIADAAKINKAMLHYYFRSKDKLFDKIFQEIFTDFINSMGNIFDREISYLEKLRLFIEIHLDFLINNQQMPAFILHEISRNPDLILDIFQINNHQNRITGFMQSTIEEIQAGRIKKINPQNLFLNILALNIFPVAARPLFMNVLRMSKVEYDELLNRRKLEVFEIVKNMLEIK